MTNRGLVALISEETGIVQHQVRDVVQKTLDHICHSLVDGTNAELRNFAVLKAEVHKARMGRNPHQPEIDVPLPSRTEVKFEPGKEMRKAVMKLSPAAPKKPEA